MKKIYSVLILAVAMAACTRSEQPQLPDEPDAPKTYRMTIEASKAPITRALQYNEDYYSLSAFWKSGETVVVTTPGASQLEKIGELTAQGFGSSTILSGEVDGSSVNGNTLVFIYPRYPYDYTGQKGTLDDLALRYDYSYQYSDYSSFNVNGDEITGSISSPFINLQAIIRFHLEDGNGDPIIADHLYIHDSSNQLVQVGYMMSGDTFGDISISLEDSSNEIWAALGYFNGNRTFNLTLTATAGEHTYICNVGQVTLQSNYFYPVKAVMKEVYTVTVDPNMQNGSVSVSPTSPIEAGTQMTLSISPGTNYALSSLILNYGGEDHDVTDYVYNNTYNFSMPEGNVNVSATFAEVPTYQVSVTVVGTGCSVDIWDGYSAPSSIVPGYTGFFPSFTEGASVNLVFVPVGNYVLDSLTDGTQDITDQVFFSFQDQMLWYEFPMPATEKHFTATFTEASGVTLGRNGYGNGQGSNWGY
jgi:hypothetical protein